VLILRHTPTNITSRKIFFPLADWKIVFRLTSYTTHERLMKSKNLDELYSSGKMVMLLVVEASSRCSAASNERVLRDPKLG
jgi:hypothetical protein